MNTMPMPIHYGEIVAIRARYGFLGRPVLQLRRKAWRARFVLPPPQEPVREDMGSSGWRDATRDDLPEVQMFLVQKGILP